MSDAIATTQAGLEAALSALDRTGARLVGVQPAGAVVDFLGPRRFLHAGPPIELEEIPGPMRGALIGALIFEGEAADAKAAAELIDGGEIELTPCHDAGAVGAMAGIVTPSTPGVVAKSEGRTLFSPLNEGLGNALRFGSYDEKTLSRLRWLADVAGPILDRAIGAGGEFELTDSVAEGLRRGDECHNRNVATSVLLIAGWAAEIVRGAPSATDAADVFQYAVGNRHFALPFSIVAAKAIADAAGRIDGSPIVTAMAGNGRRFGIRVGGTGDRWFLAPATIGDARFFEGYSERDATPTMGDSMITETVGYGAFALTAAPAITSFVGGTVDESRALVEEMRSICAGTSTRFLVPSENFRGTPIGINVHRVRELGIAPIINNGIAHREAGRGQVGAGLNRMPIEPFIEASEALQRAR